VKALTVKQPWAWAIAAGYKTVENRGRNFNYRGPLAIHAGMGWSERGAEAPHVTDAWRAYVAEQSAQSQGVVTVRYVRRGSVWSDAELACGAFVAVAELVDCHPSAGCCKPWGEDNYTRPNKAATACHHLVLENVRRLDEPIPARGALGLWTPHGLAATP